MFSQYTPYKSSTKLHLTCLYLKCTSKENFKISIFWGKQGHLNLLKSI